MSDTKTAPISADDLSLRAQQVEVEDLRRLYILNPEEHRTPLASSLHNLGASFYRLKRWGEARNAYAELADLRRLLYTVDPETYRASFASSLDDLAYCLDELGLREEARFTSAKSVDLRRALYTADPEMYRADLASSLDNFGFYLGNLSLWEDTRVAVTESINLRRVLYTANPNAYRAVLADSLHNLGFYLDKLKLWEDAQVAVTESANLRRILYTTDPKVYRADLANSLDNLGFYLSKLNLWEDARAAATESVDLQQVLYTANPEAYRAVLTGSLHNLGFYFDKLNLWEDARAAATESVDLLRVLYTADPGAYRADLARSLHSLGFYLDKLKLWEDARVAVTESVDLQRVLYAADPEAYRAKLVESLSLLTTFHRKLGNPAAADSAEKEAVASLDLTNYKIQQHQFLGAGGFGRVYQAKSEKPIYMLWDRDENKRELIVKVLRGDIGGDHSGTLSLSTDPNIQRQINREMTIWYKLLDSQHRNIVGFFGYVTNIPYGFGLISEYFSGGDIMTYLRGAVSVDRALLCHDIGRGLLHLHTFDPPIIHGDVKPLNVVVHADGRAALCDFGLSYINTSAERVESSKRVVEAPTGIMKSQTVRYTTAGYTGTLRYLSPEQLSPDLDIVKPTFAADVYAFACTLAEILTGKLPFASMKGESNIMDAILSATQPYELTEITERFPNFAFLGKCWAADPTARPSMVTICEWMGVSRW